MNASSIQILPRLAERRRIVKRKGTDPTMTQVAERAGVSIATVSRALNTPGKVRESTQRSVLNAIKELGYPLPQRPRKSDVIAVVLPEIDNPFYDKIIKGIQSSARNHAMSVILICETNVDRHLQKLLDMLSSTHVCGQITLVPVLSQDALKKLDSAAPLVQCAEYQEGSPYPFVSVDDAAAAKNAVETLIAKGRRRIAIINGPEKFKYARQRRAGYAEALRSAGLAAEPALCVHVTEMNFDSSFAVARQMLLTADPPDAILAASDLSGAAVVKAAAAEHLRIPEDLSLIAFDNTYISQLCHPSVTAVNMPQFQLGYMACEVLAERIQNPHSKEPRQYMLKTELVLRDSI